MAAENTQLEPGKTRSRADVLIRLSVMMFLQYAVWGSWLPILARYLEAPRTDIHFKDVKALVGQIHQQAQADQPSPGKRVWELLTPQTRQRVSDLSEGRAEWTDQAADALAAELNDVLAEKKLDEAKHPDADKNRQFFRAEHFAVPDLDEAALGKLKAHQEGKTKPLGADVTALNRQVFHSAYPQLTELGKGGLAFTAGMVGLLLGLAGSIGALTAPLIAGQVADRYFSAQRFLAVLLVLGGAVKWYTAYQTSYPAWLWLSVIYSVLFMPTLALSNSIAFAHMRNQEREFPLVRVWGTIGWIAASWAFPLIWLQSRIGASWLPPFFTGIELPFATHRLANSLIFSALISFAYAGYCLLLPDTPPKREGVERLAFVKAFKLLGRPSVALLVAASLPISVIHQVYFMQTSTFLSNIGLKDSYIGPAMTIGQFAEIFVMALLGVMLAKLRFRAVILIGILAYVARYAVFGTIGLPRSLIVSSQVLHGFCYACFFAASFIYIDRIAPPDIRHSAQTLYGIFILGLGPVLGGLFIQQVDQWVSPAGLPDKFQGMWYIQAVVALITGLLFVAGFRSEVEPPGRSTASITGQEELAEMKR